MELNNDEIRRYSRHLILPEVGLAGQKKIKAASVLCIGAGVLPVDTHSHRIIVKP
jgi:adenylyltransferase/sulfurtransferase